MDPGDEPVAAAAQATGEIKSGGEEEKTIDDEDDDDDIDYDLYEICKDSQDDMCIEPEVLSEHALIEQAKEEVRIQLRELKAMFRSIKQRNMEIPEQFRVPDEKLKLPREIYAHIHQKIEIECDEVYRIHEYESAETLVQLDKIRNFYLDPIDTPNIVVKDISHVLQTHTIRNRKVTQEFQNLIVKNKEIMEEERRILEARADKRDADESQGAEPVKRIYAKDIIGEYESKIDTYDIETVHNIRHLEKRLEQRYERECAWQVLMAKKIAPDWMPPEDEEKLLNAKAETGAFRLQTSDTFLGEQITVAQRRQRIIDMKMEMRKKVVEFNSMVVEARDEKPKVLQECRRLEKEIRKLHVLLPEEYRRKVPPIYDMEPDENPESMLDITLEDVEAEENVMLEAAGLLSIKEDILEEFFGIKKPEYIKPFDDWDKPAFVPPPAATAARQTKAVDLEHESVASHRCRKYYFTPQTDLEKKRFEVQFYPRLYRQEMLFNDLTRVINYYHQRIKFLHDFRIQLEVELKVKMVGLMTMISELDIAKEFDAQEKAILERLRAQKAESKDAKYQMDKIQKKLVKCTADQKRYKLELASITKEVEGLIGGKGRFSDYLWRVFKKKIKLDGPEEEDASEIVRRHSSSSSNSTDSSNSTSQDSGSDLYKMPKQKLDVNLCPEHLDRNIYNKICELRQRKATVENEVESHKKTAERVSGEFLEIEKVYQKYEGRIGDISEEIRVLQRRRQKRMNDLKLMVVLRPDQIQCMDMDDLADLNGDILEKLAQTFPSTSNIIIFPKGGSDDLDKRSGELNKKAKEERERYKKGKHMLIRLREELKKAEREVEILQEKVQKEMVLKFGQEVDLDKITAVIINLELLDNEIILDRMKNDQYKEREKVNKELDEVKYGWTQKVKENSKCNMIKAMMLERRRDLEYYIWKNERDNIEASSILNVEAGGGDVSMQLQTFSKISDSCLTASDPQSRIFNDGPLEEEIENLKQVLKKQTDRILKLKDTLQKCRTKSGLPPLLKIIDKDIPTKTAFPNQPQMYMRTAKELPFLNQYCRQDNVTIQCGVQTIYKGNITPSLQQSSSLTQASLDNVDEMAQDETNEVFGDYSEMNYDYSSGEEEEEAQGGAAAVRQFQEAISEMLPDEEEEFMQYMEDSQMLADIDEMDQFELSTIAGIENPLSSSGGKSGSGKSSSGRAKKNRPVQEQERERDHVKFIAPKKSAPAVVDEVVDDDNRSRKSSRKSGRSMRERKASRKSYVAIAEGIKSITAEQVLDRVRKFSVGTELSRQEQEVIDGIVPESDEQSLAKIKENVEKERKSLKK